MANPMPLVDPVTIALFCSAIIVLLIVPLGRLDARLRKKLGPESGLWPLRGIHGFIGGTILRIGVRRLPDPPWRGFGLIRRGVGHLCAADAAQGAPAYPGRQSLGCSSVRWGDHWPGHSAWRVPRQFIGCHGNPDLGD